MKKFLTLLLCVVLIVCFMPTMAFADGGENGKMCIRDRN